MLLAALTVVVLTVTALTVVVLVVTALKDKMLCALASTVRRRRK